MNNQLVSRLITFAVLTMMGLAVWNIVNARADCMRRGGVPVTIQWQTVCYNASSVIPQ